MNEIIKNNDKKIVVRISKTKSDTPQEPREQSYALTMM